MEDGKWNQPTFEHIIMRCFGGPMRRDNLVLTCRRCNLNGKAQKIWARFCGANQLPIDWHLNENRC
jgi:5-methylcytosine-specific restriction endonuclease McrA